MIIDDIELSELLTVKICHDLSGPVGAVNNGTELLKEGSEYVHDKSIELIEGSARDAIDRILFFRSAYGSGRSSSETTIETLQKLSVGFFRQKNIEIDWQVDGAVSSLSNEYAKIGLNLLILLSSILISGGKISIKIIRNNKKFEFETECIGDSIKKDVEGLNIATGKDKEPIVTVHNVQSYLTLRLLQRSKMKAKYNINDGSVELKAA